jgi:hypothetical protein
MRFSIPLKNLRVRQHQKKHCGACMRVFYFTAENENLLYCTHAPQAKQASNKQKQPQQRTGNCSFADSNKPNNAIFKRAIANTRP